MRRLLIAAILFLFCTLGLQAQEYWSAGLLCGNAAPLGPSKLTNQWYNGSVLSGCIELDLNPRLSTSIIAGFTHLPNYERSIQYRSSLLPCIGGGHRNILSLTGGAKMYVWNYQAAQVYIGGNFGLANNAITSIVFRRPSGTYTEKGFSTINLTAGLNLGTDLLIDDRIAIRLDIAYQLMEDGYVINQYLPIQMGLVYHWTGALTSVHR